MSDPSGQQSPTEVVDPRVPPPAVVQSASGRTVSKRITDLVEGPAARKPGTVGELSDAKETYARGIALIITWTFAISAFMILIGIFCLLRIHPADAETVLVKAGIPAIKEAGTFLSSVFGPLLAFVLGYYFGERKAKDR